MLTLESLIEKARQEAVSQEEVVETIQQDPEFYTKLFEEGGKDRRIIQIQGFLTDMIFQRTNSRLRANLEDYLEIKSLDEITSENATPRLGTILDFKAYHPNEFKSRLVELGIFSEDLRQYDPLVREEILTRVVSKLSNHNFRSSYFSPDIEESVLKENRRQLGKSEAFKSYLQEREIRSLDDITGKKATQGLEPIIGFKAYHPHEFRSRLVELGIFSQDLKEYDPLVREEILRKVLRRLSNTRFRSSYFSPDIEESVLEENRRQLGKSEVFKSYLQEREIRSLDDITKENATRGLGKIIGFKVKRYTEFRSRLVELGIFSEDLRQYDPQKREEIVHTNLLRGKRKGIYNLAYFSDENPYVDENRRILLESKTFQDYLASEGIELSNLQTIKGENKTLMRRLLGTTIQNLPKIQKVTSSPKYHKIITEWTEQYVQDLINIFNNNSNIAKYFREHKQTLEEQFGRTIFALEKKLEHLGLLPPYQPTGNGTPQVATYPFPKLHGERAQIYTKNSATLLDALIQPEIIPAWGFESATHEQFIHMTVPIYFNGIDLNGYNPREQEVIQTLHTYLALPQTFRETQLQGRKVIESTMLAPDPSIIILELDEERYVGLIRRKRFIEDPSQITTQAINLNGREIYFFKHDQTDVTFKNTRRS